MNKAVVFMIGFSVGWVLMPIIEHKDTGISRKSEKIVELCEQYIPRNQTCEIYIEARVKK